MASLLRGLAGAGRGFRQEKEEEEREDSLEEQGDIQDEEGSTEESGLRARAVAMQSSESKTIDPSPGTFNSQAMQDASSELEQRTAALRGREQALDEEFGRSLLSAMEARQRILEQREARPVFFDSLGLGSLCFSWALCNKKCKVLSCYRFIEASWPHFRPARRPPASRQKNCSSSWNRKLQL